MKQKQTKQKIIEKTVKLPKGFSITIVEYKNHSLIVTLSEDIKINGVTHKDVPVRVILGL